MLYPAVGAVSYTHLQAVTPQITSVSPSTMEKPAWLLAKGILSDDTFMPYKPLTTVGTADVYKRQLRSRRKGLVRPGRCGTGGKRDPSGRCASSSPDRGAF